MPPEELVHWIALNLLPGLGPLTTRRALERFGDPALIAHRLPVSALSELPGFGRDAAADLAGARAGLERRAYAELERSRKLGLDLIALGDPRYPAGLAELSDPPILLYLRGSIGPGVVRIAVVGSRRATAYGKRVATGLGSALAARGIEVVSGGARGIDTSAHFGALEEGGRTVAVLGSGFHRLYPPENEELFARVAASGAVLSEFPLDVPPRPENFPRRNRLISALSAAVVVVEATRRSGSLSTANHALEQGREVLAVPGPVHSDRSEGCHRLIQQGAKLLQNVDDLIEELSPMYRDALSAAPEPGARGGGPDPLVGIGPDEAAVAELLDEIEAVQLDELADRAPFGVARLQAALFGLELRGAVEQLPGRHFRLLPRRGLSAGPP